jgi:hypothetical protein
MRPAFMAVRWTDLRKELSAGPSKLSKRRPRCQVGDAPDVKTDPTGRCLHRKDWWGLRSDPWRLGSL